MRKNCLNIKDLESVCGGKMYPAIESFDVSKEAALVLLPRCLLAFNVDSKMQIRKIIERTPAFDGFVELDETKIKMYKWFELCELHKEFKPNFLVKRTFEAYNKMSGK